MENIKILIPVVDSTVQDFSELVNILCGGYIAEDKVQINKDENGKDVETIIENPYKGITNPDYSNKIVFVSADPNFTAPANTESVFVPEINIAHMWNSGIDYAQADRTVILNEVSSINPHVFAEVVAESDSDIINLSDGGCFIVKPSVHADERFKWYFADVLLFKNNDTDVIRKDFLDIVQENAMGNRESVSGLIAADIELFNSLQ